MSVDLEKRVTKLEYDMEALDVRVRRQGESIVRIEILLDKILVVLSRVQYIGYGIAIYYVMDNLGFVQALKLATGVIGA